MRTKGSPNKPKHCNIELSKLIEILKPSALIPVQMSWAEALFSVEDLCNVKDVINKDIPDNDVDQPSDKIKLSTTVVEFD